MIQSRREFFKKTLGGCTLLSLAPTVPALWSRTARAARDADDRRDTVLIVLQLSGGNDGLNTIVPYGDDEYGRHRRTLRLTGQDVHKIDAYAGFHPRMQGFAKLFAEGRLSVVQGVGYPNSDRGHDGAMRNWHTARPEDSNCPTGWLGRTIDSVHHQDSSELTGVFVGPVAQPFALNAEHSIVPSIRSAADLTFRGLPAGGGRTLQQQTLNIDETDEASDDDSLLEFVRRSTVATRATSRQVKDVLASAPGTTEYPRHPLATQLKTIAQLIRADVGIRIFFAELGGGGIGGFDNHANQRDNHAALLKQLSESITALVDDLARDGQLGRTLLMTFSEFGRTLPENGRRGTGHGDAQPIFVTGGRVKGGVVGAHPSLTDLAQGAPKFHTDFRRVFATMLESWLGFDATAVLDKRYEPLDLLQS